MEDESHSTTKGLSESFATASEELPLSPPLRSSFNITQSWLHSQFSEIQGSTLPKSEVYDVYLSFCQDSYTLLFYDQLSEKWCLKSFQA
jgi:hypothetical protein